MSRSASEKLQAGHVEHQSHYSHNKLTSTAHTALIDLLVSQNIMHHLSRVLMKHLSITANQTSINFDNVFTNALPELVVVGLVSDANLAGD